MKLYSWLFSVFIGIVSVIAMLYVALVPLVFNKGFYYEQFKENKSYEEAGVNEEQLNLVIDHLIDYLKDNESDLQMMIRLEDGTTKDAFTEREIIHMIDVKNLFIGGSIIGIAAIILSIMSITLLLLKRDWFHAKTTKYIKYVIFGIIGLFVLVTLYVLIDFDSFFDLFHEMFFTNDMWLLDEDTMLIIMFTETLFLIIVIEILLLFFIYLLTYLLFLNSYETRKKVFSSLYNL